MNNCSSGCNNCSCIWIILLLICCGGCGNGAGGFGMNDSCGCNSGCDCLLPLLIVWLCCGNCGCGCN